MSKIIELPVYMNGQQIGWVRVPYLYTGIVSITNNQGKSRGYAVEFMPKIGFAVICYSFEDVVFLTSSVSEFVKV